MEHYIFYCKLSLLAVLSLITACCMLSRRWYVNLVAFLACLSGETFLAHLFFPGYMLCPAAASFIILFLSRIWDPYHDQGAFTSRQHGRPSPQQGDPSGRGYPFRPRAGSTDSLQHHPSRRQEAHGRREPAGYGMRISGVSPGSARESGMEM